MTKSSLCEGDRVCFSLQFHLESITGERNTRHGRKLETGTEVETMEKLTGTNLMSLSQLVRKALRDVSDPTQFFKHSNLLPPQGLFMCCFFSLSHVIGPFSSLLSQFKCQHLKFFPAHLGQVAPESPSLFSSFVAKLIFPFVIFINSLPQKNTWCILYNCYLFIIPSNPIHRTMSVMWWYLLNICRIKAFLLYPENGSQGPSRWLSR